MGAGVFSDPERAGGSTSKLGETGVLCGAFSWYHPPKPQPHHLPSSSSLPSGGLFGEPRAFLFVAACPPLSQFVQLTMLERHCLSWSPNAGGRQRLMPPRTNPTPHCCAPTEGSAQNLWPVLLQEARHFQVQGELPRHVGCENSHHRGWKVRGWAWQGGDKDDVTPSNSERSR